MRDVWLLNWVLPSSHEKTIMDWLSEDLRPLLNRFCIIFFARNSFGFSRFVAIGLVAGKMSFMKSYVPFYHSPHKCLLLYEKWNRWIYIFCMNWPTLFSCFDKIWWIKEKSFYFLQRNYHFLLFFSLLHY